MKSTIITAIIKQGLWILLLSGSLVSCNKDLGNYQYTEVNKVDTLFGLNDTLAIYNSQLKIKPVLRFTLDQSVKPEDFSYEWMYMKEKDQDKKVIISTDKELDYKVVLTPGNYLMFYAVKSKSTGIEQRFSFNLQVANQYNEGWMLLTEVEGKARLDMISLNYDKRKFEVIQNILKVAESPLVLAGKPKSIYGYNAGSLPTLGASFNYAFYINTTEDGYRIDPNTFNWQENYTLSKEMIGGKPHTSAEIIIRNGYNRAYMVNDEDIYLYDQRNQVPFGAPINRISQKNQHFKVAPFIVSNETSNVGSASIFFDKTYKRFVKHVGIATSCTEIPDPTTDKLFSFQIDMDLCYMTRSEFNNAEAFSVLEDPISKKRYIARFNPISNNQSYFDEIHVPNIEKATNFAVNSLYGYLFFSIDSKVYEYDLVLRKAKLMLDYGTHKISLLKFQVYHNSVKYPDRNDLIVCSYDPSKPAAGQGKMEIYSVPGLNESLILKASYADIGKVHSLFYRER